MRWGVEEAHISIEVGSYDVRSNGITVDSSNPLSSFAPPSASPTYRFYPCTGMLRAGQIVGDRYRLEEPVGDGGMGCVWRATQLVLERSVAIKFLYARGPNPALQAERFLREARVAAAVDHRNVVDILDVGVTEEGQSYMVMTFLRGVTLADRLDKGPPLSVDELVRIVSLSLRGLDAVHKAGIVHRDLKPENIFLVDDPEGAYPRLLDFGISRILSSESGRRSPLTTREGVMVGTPQYMSPEQARGLRDLDERSDIYSMGVILYEALSGSLPFDSDAIGDLIIMIVSKQAPTLAQLRPEIGELLSDVVRRAMSKKREQRFETALEMQGALLDAAQGVPKTLSERSLSTRPRPGRSLFPPPVKIPELVLSQLGKKPKSGLAVPDFPQAETTRQLWEMARPPAAAQAPDWLEQDRTTLPVSRPPRDVPPEAVPGKVGNRVAEVATRLRARTAKSVQGVRSYLATGSQTFVGLVGTPRARLVALAGTLVAMVLVAAAVSLNGDADASSQGNSQEKAVVASGNNGSPQSIGGKSESGSGPGSASASSTSGNSADQLVSARDGVPAESASDASSGVLMPGSASTAATAPSAERAGTAQTGTEAESEARGAEPAQKTPEARKSTRKKRASARSRRAARARRAKARRRAQRTSGGSSQTRKSTESAAPVLRQPDY